VQGIEFSIHARQDRVNHHLQLAQQLRLRNAFFQVAELNRAA
jgi:hypothetical protein